MIKNSVTIRASAWGTLFDCAHRFEWSILMKNRRAPVMRTALGSAIHHATAAYDQAVIDGTEFSASDATQALVDYLNNPPEPVDLGNSDITKERAVAIGLNLLMRYINEIAPTMDYVDVETTLDPLYIDCGGGTELVLTGQMDRGRLERIGFDGAEVPCDVKSGTRVINGDGDVNVKPYIAQLGVYQVMVDQTKKIQTAGSRIIALSTSSRQQAAVSPIFDARKRLLGEPETDFGPAVPGLIDYAAEMVRSGLYPPNPQSSLCSERYCARWDVCKFHE